MSHRGKLGSALRFPRGNGGALPVFRRNRRRAVPSRLRWPIFGPKYPARAAGRAILWDVVTLGRC